MTLSICLPVLNQEEITQQTFNKLKSLQKNDNHYIIIDNGCDRPVRDWLIGLTGDDIVIQNSKNVGLPKALNQALKINRADYMLATHTDVVMYEQDWDDKIIKAIEEHGNVGVAGFFGALGIGSPEIYKTPYMMQQLVRTNPIAGHKCKLNPGVHHHSQFTQDWHKCAVLDGFGLVVQKDLRFEVSFGAHHMYDNDICLQSIDKGFENIVVNLDVDHLGGRTDVGEDWASPFGKTKAEIHRDSHPPFYEKWKPGNKNITLPYRVQ